ncbi:MAG: glycosyltransferase family 39 protein, partial [Polyangiales bacterium]
MSRSSATASVALISAGARVAGALVLVVCGFRAVSDDDFARVVIAQRFAAAPHLDPTGTSWLPLPFWLVGSGMKVFGASLLVARVLAIVSAAVAGAIVGAMATAIGLSRRRAITGALLAAAMPWAMQLAVATVPEVPAAACAAAGAMALASRSSRLRLLGAVAL